MELGERIYNGDRAKEVIENEAYQNAFALIEQEIYEQWKTSPQRDAEGREKLFLYHAMLNKLRQTLQTTLETGKLARLDLDHQESLAKRLTANASRIFSVR